MLGVNKVILIGNLGKDPEVKFLEDNNAVASFTLATSESYKDKSGQKIVQTEWHNIKLWGGLAKIADKYLKKGSTIYLEGKIRTRSYEKDGVKKYITEIVGDNMTMLGKRPEGGDQTKENQASYGESFSNDAPADDLPF